MSSVFISDRQDDAKAWAVLLRDRLGEAFGSDGVFLDEDAIASGPWQEQIDAALERCKVVLIVVGPRWLTVADDAGPRLRQPGDVHRAEIEMALKRPHITVIPVLVEGTPMPRADELPPSIQALASWQARALSSADRRRTVDLETIAADIARATGLTPRRRPPPTRWLVTALWVVLAAIGATIALLVAVQVVLGWQFGPDEIRAIALGMARGWTGRTGAS